MNVGQDGHGAFRVVRGDFVGERVLNLVLQRLVDSEHEIRALAGRGLLVGAVGECLALGVLLDDEAAGLATEGRLLTGFDTAQAGVVGPDEAEQRGGERIGWVVPLRLGLEADSG